ncbi:MAG: hypothetical protein OXC03_09880 [Flavobacteriaceae bacterium]|nr:hypothetical protein [Flavobacteriaceae bacterium]
MKPSKCFLYLLIICLIYSCTATEILVENEQGEWSHEIPYLVGESRKVFDAKPPDATDNMRWFTNDHNFVIDKSGKLHWFGINNPYPPPGKSLYRYHPYLGHLTTEEPLGEWKREAFAIDESQGTEYVGAPYVIWHEESRRWVMVVETMLNGRRRMEVVWSDDLYKWERTYKAILPQSLWLTSRDPHIMKGTDGKYWIHLVSKDGSKRPTLSQVVRLKTIDFVNFEGPLPVMSIADNAPSSGIESPFIVERDGLWYLFFTYAHRRYAETIVVLSDNSDYFDYNENVITTLFGHAAEIFEYKGKTYISSCGPEDRHWLNHQSVSLAELIWLKYYD